MDDDRFLDLVKDRAGLDSRESAITVTGAVLDELAQVLTQGAAGALADSLPGVAATPLATRGSSPDESERQGRGASSDEFLTGVGRRLGTGDVGEASGATQAVFRAVAECADPDAAEAAREQLTAELRGLLAPATEESRAAR